MTPEQKDLLLKDLCSRIPYGVRCRIEDPVMHDLSFVLNGIIIGDDAVFLKRVYTVYYPEDIKPYLFPLSSITPEQEKELNELGLGYGEYGFHDDIYGRGIMVDEAYEFYKWNPETKTLEKLVEPKFKKGDKVRTRSVFSQCRIIDDVFDTFYSLVPIGKIDFTDQDNWELVPNVEPKFKVGDRIKDTRGNSEGIILEITDEGYKCHFEFGNFLVTFNEQDYFNLVPHKFDIRTLKPFESKVLVRHSETSIWMPAIFGGYDIPNLAYYAVGGTWWKYCIPYKGNEYLRGTPNDCNDYYKTWK